MRPVPAIAACVLLAVLTALLPATGAAHAAPEETEPALPHLRSLTEDAVQEILDTDPAARLDSLGRLLFADRREATLPGPEQPARAIAPQGKTFRLHSRPGSRRVIYLDFDGEQVCGTAWNRGGLLGLSGLPCGRYAGWFSANGADSFSKAQKRQIQEVWARVSEDFAVFDVDVTTERPSQSALTRSDPGDRSFGVHAVVSASTQARNSTCGGPGCAGVAYMSVFPEHRANDARIFWAFPNEIGNSPRLLADVLSHEAGHTLGLDHDGTSTKAYYGGHGIWAPIMGSGTRHLTQWSKGEYAGANQRQNDLKVMRQHGIPRLRDDHGAKRKTATPVRRKTKMAGVVNSGSDVDAFTFRTTCRKPIKVKARNAPHGPNLDIRLTVKRPNKRAKHFNPLSARSGNATGLDATWKGKGKRGVWLVKVRGTGARNPATTGYSAYGSIGAYTLQVTGRCVKR